MKEKTVVIEIDEQGNSTVDLNGFQGKGCGDVAKAFQSDDLVKSSRTKADFYFQKSVDKRRQQKS